MGKYLTVLLLFLSCALVFASLGLRGAYASQSSSSPDGGLPDAKTSDAGNGPADFSSVTTRPVMGWLARTNSTSDLAAQALGLVMDELADLDMEWTDSGSLLAMLKHRDETEGILSQARLHLEKGRKLHLGLNLEKAEAEYKKSIELLQQGFALYYEPALLSEPLLQLGVAQYQAGDKVMARQTFMRVAALTPELKLAEGYYSPSIRKAYAEAVSGLGLREPTIPAPGELRRICEALDIRGLVVASSEKLGGRPLLRLGVFDRSYGSFVAVQTMVLSKEDVSKASGQLAKRLKPAIAAMLGLGLDGGAADGQGSRSDEDESADAGLSDAGLPGRTVDDGGLGAIDFNDAPAPYGEQGKAEPSWAVRYWWIWPVTAAVITSIAVTLPLTVFREDVVDVKVSY